MEERPLKKTEVLAIENIRRIADQIRSERNDALAIAQEKRDQIESCIVLLNEIRTQILEPDSGSAQKEIAAKIDNFLTTLSRD